MKKREDEGRFGLLGAFGVSIAVHVLLALLTLVVPIVAETVALDELEPATEITFSFVDRPDLEEDVNAQDVPPAGTEPIPLPVPPEPPAFEEPLDVEPLDAESEPPIEEPEELEPEKTSEAPPPPLEEVGSEAEPQASAESGTRPPLDVSRALRDYEKMLSQRPPSPRRSQPNSPRNVIVPDFSAIPQSGFGMGNLTFESTDYDWTDYGRQVYMAIWRAWHRRLWMTTDDFEKWSHESGQSYLRNQTQVGFVIERNGQVTGIVKELRSGCLPLDDSALDALAEVILPPLPADFPRDREVVHARFIAEGAVRDMRPHLGYLKQMGSF